MNKRGIVICCVLCILICFLFLGFAIVILVLDQIGYIKKKVDGYVLKQLTLEKGHQTYEQWVNPTIPMYKDFYIYNLTNPAEFRDGAKPRFDELGPYRYRERRVKTVLYHDHEDGTIVYTMNRTFHFEQFENFSEGDVITTINFVYVTALNYTEEHGETDLLKFLIRFLMSPKPDLLIQVKVADLFWNYTDHFLQKLYDYRQVTHVTSPYINLQYNNSALDALRTSIIYSGETNSRLTAQFIQWAGNKTLTIWRNSGNIVTGTEGMLWQPFLKQDDVVSAFIIDAERSFRLRYNRKSSVLGINAYHFLVDADEFLPNPNYWTTNSTPHGLLYLGAIEEPKVPVWGSKPHFLDCDPSLLSAVEGIRGPDRNLDDCIADIEPITGCTINGHLRLQININVTKSSPSFPFHNINPPLYFPMFYVDEWAVIDEELKSQLNKMVFMPLTAIAVSVWVAFGLCCFISLLTGLIAINRCVKLYKLYHHDEIKIPLLEQINT